jgi:hypothetical protein
LTNDGNLFFIAKNNSLPAGKIFTTAKDDAERESAQGWRSKFESRAVINEVARMLLRKSNLMDGVIDERRRRVKALNRLLIR